MPPSVAFVDLNGDGKPDLITADPTGYFRFYPNDGTPTAPHFTTGEILPFFVSTTFRPREHVWSDFAAQDYWRFCPRFALADWRHGGVLDFLIGNYYGELLFIPNAGTARQPVFRQPSRGPEGSADFHERKEPLLGQPPLPRRRRLERQRSCGPRHRRGHLLRRCHPSA